MHKRSILKVGRKTRTEDEKMTKDAPSAEALLRAKLDAKAAPVAKPASSISLRAEARKILLSSMLETIALARSHNPELADMMFAQYERAARTFGQL
jgi:hypothetical protein